MHGPNKVGAIAAKTSLDQLFAQYMCTVMDEVNHSPNLPYSEGLGSLEAKQCAPRCSRGSLVP